MFAINFASTLFFFCAKNSEKISVRTSDDHLCCLKENAFKGDLNQKNVCLSIPVLPKIEIKIIC